ncbi:MAG: hypothetical protein OHK0041_25060 [Anaerolineales bacterium]
MTNTQTHYASLLGFFLFAFSALLLFGLAFFLGVSLLLMYLKAGAFAVPAAIYVFTTAFLGILVSAAAVAALLRFLNQPAAHAPVSTAFPAWQIGAGILGGGLALFVGYLIQYNQAVNWLILPLLTVPAVMLPLWTIVGLGVRGISLGSRWRTWGALGVSLTLTPFVLVVIEIILIIIIIVLVVVYVGAQPNLTAEFERLAAQLMFLDLETEMGMDAMLRLITPLLMRPAVLLPILMMFSLLIPLVEELFKPLVVWIFARRLESPAQGFAFGALSGAGFAIWETFNASGQMNEWGSVLVSRIGTGLLHVTTSALMGLAIFLAWRERRYLRLLGTYLLVVLLHGIWNAAAIMVSFSALSVEYLQTGGFRSLQWISSGVLVALIGILLAILLMNNRRLRQAAAAPPVEAALPAADSDNMPKDV